MACFCEYETTAGTTGDYRPNRPKLSTKEVSLIRQMHSLGVSGAELAAAFDVHPATVSRVVRGIYHREVA